MEALGRLSDAALRALMAVNGLRRASTDRREDYAHRVHAFLRIHPSRQLAFPAVVQRARQGPTEPEVGAAELEGSGGEAEGSHAPTEPPH